MTTDTELTEEQARRVETMRYNGVLQCPSWCLRIDDEDQYETHFGEWRPILEDAGEDGDVTVWVRPVRDWWDASENQAEGRSYVDVAVTNVADPSSNPVPLPDGMSLLSYLSGADIDALISGLDEANEQAHMTASGVEWVRAFDGAEDLAEDEAGEGGDG